MNVDLKKPAIVAVIVSFLITFFYFSHQSIFFYNVSRKKGYVEKATFFVTPSKDKMFVEETFNYKVFKGARYVYREFKGRYPSFKLISFSCSYGEKQEQNYSKAAYDKDYVYKTVSCYFGRVKEERNVILKVKYEVTPYIKGKDGNIFLVYDFGKYDILNGRIVLNCQNCENTLYQPSREFSYFSGNVALLTKLPKNYKYALEVEYDPYKKFLSAVNLENASNRAEPVRVFITLSLFFSFLFSLLYLFYLSYNSRKLVSNPPYFLREPPEKIKPYEVDFFFNGDIEDTTEDGFYATALDLIRRKKLKLKEEKDDVLFESLDEEGLDEVEKIVGSSLVSVGRIPKKKPLFMPPELINKLRMLYFSKASYDNLVRQKLAEKKKKYYNSRVFISFLGIHFLALMFILFFGLFSKVLGIIFILLFLLFFLALFLKSKLVLYTKEGAEVYAKWNAFKKFLSDVSLIEKYPPDSIILWEEYLVYAVALGVAKKSINYFREKLELYKDKYGYDHYGGMVAFTLVTTSYGNSFFYSPASSSHGGGGGFGGGFGGGGGGVG